MPLIVTSKDITILKNFNQKPQNTQNLKKSKSKTPKFTIIFFIFTIKTWECIANDFRKLYVNYKSNPIDSYGDATFNFLPVFP